MFRTGNFSEDFSGGIGPDVGLGLIVVCVEIVDDSLLQFIDALEDAAADALSPRPGVLDLPGRRGSRRRVTISSSRGVSRCLVDAWTEGDQTHEQHQDSAGLHSRFRA